MALMKQISALDGGTLSVPSLTTAYLPFPLDEYNFFLQSRCYLFAEGQTAAKLRVTFGFLAEYTIWNVYPDVNGVAYIPLNDLFAYFFKRQSLDTMGLVNVYGNITVEAVADDGTVNDSVNFTANIYDCTGLRGGYQMSGFCHLLPDTFRIPLSPGFNPFVNLGCRLTAGCNLVILNSGGSDYQYYQRDAGGEAVGVNLKLKGHPAYMRVYNDAVTPDPASLAAEARFELVDCMDDKLLLTWWSVEDGFYKSRVADVVGGGSSQLNAIDYIHDFEGRTAKEVDTYVSARFANLSQRDWEYYRDLLMSDEIYVNAPMDLAGMPAELTNVPVRIDGSVPQRKGQQPTTMDFNVIFNQYSEL